MEVIAVKSSKRRVLLCMVVIASILCVAVALVLADCCAPTPGNVDCPSNCTEGGRHDTVYWCYNCEEDIVNPPVPRCCWYRCERYRCHPKPGYSSCHPPYARKDCKRQNPKNLVCPPNPSTSDCFGNPMGNP